MKLYFIQQSLQFHVPWARFVGPVFPEVNTNSESYVFSATGSTTTYFNIVVYILNLISETNYPGTTTTVDIKQANDGHNTSKLVLCLYRVFHDLWTLLQEVIS